MKTDIDVADTFKYLSQGVKVDTSGLTPREKPSGAWQFKGVITIDFYAGDHEADSLTDTGTFQEGEFLDRFGFNLVRS